MESECLICGKLFEGVVPAVICDNCLFGEPDDDDEPFDASHDIHREASDEFYDAWESYEGDDE